MRERERKRERDEERKRERKREREAERDGERDELTERGEAKRESYSDKIDCRSVSHHGKWRN